MAYDQALAERIRELLLDESDVSERKMFGGLAFLVGGRMAVSVSSRGGIFVRVDPTDLDRLVDTTAARPMEMRGREMHGWLRIGAEALATKRQLATWVSTGVRYVRSMPA